MFIQCHNLFDKLFSTNFMATSGTMFCLNIQMHMSDSAEWSKLIMVDIAQHTVLLVVHNER